MTFSAASTSSERSGRGKMYGTESTRTSTPSSAREIDRLGERSLVRPPRDHERVGVCVAELARAPVLALLGGIDFPVALIDLLDAHPGILGPTTLLVVFEAGGHVRAVGGAGERPRRDPVVGDLVGLEAARLAHVVVDRRLVDDEATVDLHLVHVEGVRRERLLGDRHREVGW